MPIRVDVGPWHHPTPRSVRARVRVAVTAAAVGAGVIGAVPRIEDWFPPAPGATPVAVALTTGVIVLVAVEAGTAAPDERPGGAAWTCLAGAVGLTVWAVAGGPTWVLPGAALLAVPAGLAAAGADDEPDIQLRGTAWLCWAATGVAAAVRTGLGPGAFAVAFLLGLAAFGLLHGVVTLALTEPAYDVVDLDVTVAAAGLFLTGGGMTLAASGPPAVGASIAVIGVSIVLGRVVAVVETYGRPRVGMSGPIAVAGLGVTGLGVGVLHEGGVGAGIVIALVGALIVAAAVRSAVSRARS